MLQTEAGNQPYGPFPQGIALTEALDVRLIPTPGHSPGHISVVLDTNTDYYFFAGDTGGLTRW